MQCLVESSSCGPAFLPVCFCLYLGVAKGQECCCDCRSSSQPGHSAREASWQILLFISLPPFLDCWPFIIGENHMNLEVGSTRKLWFLTITGPWRVHQSFVPLTFHPGMCPTYSQPFHPLSKHSNSTLVVMFCRRLLYILLRQPTSLSWRTSLLFISKFLFLLHKRKQGPLCCLKCLFLPFPRKHASLIKDLHISPFNCLLLSPLPEDILDESEPFGCKQKNPTSMHFSQRKRTLF